MGDFKGTGQGMGASQVAGKSSDGKEERLGYYFGHYLASSSFGVLDQYSSHSPRPTSSTCHFDQFGFDLAAA